MSAVSAAGRTARSVAIVIGASSSLLSASSNTGSTLRPSLDTLTSFCACQPAACVIAWAASAATHKLVGDAAAACAAAAAEDGRVVVCPVEAVYGEGVCWVRAVVGARHCISECCCCCWW